MTRSTPKNAADFHASALGNDPTKFSHSNRSRGKTPLSLPLEQAAKPGNVTPFRRPKKTNRSRGKLDPDWIVTEILKIFREGPVAPEGCWLETAKVPRREFRQVFYRAREPIFDGKRGGKVKRLYVGKAGSNKHKAAQVSIKRRNEITRLRKLLSAEDKATLKTLLTNPDS